MVDVLPALVKAHHAEPEQKAQEFVAANEEGHKEHSDPEGGLGVGAAAGAEGLGEASVVLTLIHDGYVCYVCLVHSKY